MINLGLIGCGGFGRYHAECISGIPDARFSAFADIEEKNAVGFRETFGGDYSTTCYEDIINDKQIDAVYICTRNDSHAEIAVAAARAGKHFLLEKPVALSLAACKHVANETEQAGVHAMAAFKYRFYSSIMEAHRFIPEPEIIVAQMMDRRWPDNSWAQDAVQGGGNVHSQGCHMTDILCYLANSTPVKLWASGGNFTHPGHPFIDQCAATLQFDNGRIASWIQGDIAEGKATGKVFLQLFGNGKSVQLYDRCTRGIFSDGTRSWTKEYEEDGIRRENEEFVNALMSGRAPRPGLDAGVMATRLVHLAEMSIRTGAVQEINLVCA